MGKNFTITATFSTGLALAGGLLLAGAAWSQDAGGGLVISALPSETVIGASGSAVITPVVQPVIPLAGSATDPAAPPTDQRRRADMPRPSIIVGDLAILAAIGPRGPMGLPFPTREAIRQRDPGLFERLLGRGVFDPDSDRMAEAIQTELQRMQCYGGSIDGRWGSGSSGAAERWRKAAEVQVATDAQTPLFRAIARSGDMRCPAVAQSRPVVAKQNTNRPRGNGSGGQRSPSSRTPQSQTTTPGQGTSPRINPSLLGAGMYR